MSGAANDVSNSHEPSYYEIALTNRQVVVAFVILLLCLIAAFFSGVWIGRESGARIAAEQMVRNAPPPEEEKKEGQNLEELDFFDGSKKAKPGKAEATEAETAAPAPVAAAPVPPPPRPREEPAAEPADGEPAAAGIDPSLSDDLTGEDMEAGAGAPAPTPAVPPRAQRQKPVPEKPVPAVVEPRTAQAKPEPPAAKPAKRPAAEAPEPARGAGKLVIQVFSSAEKDQALRIRDRLVGGGFKAYLSPVEVSGRTMYRVRVGPFGTRDQAQKTAEQVRKGYKLDTWVTE